jgi:hypothetical protein
MDMDFTPEKIPVNPTKKSKTKKPPVSGGLLEF